MAGRMVGRMIKQIDFLNINSSLRIISGGMWWRTFHLLQEATKSAEDRAAIDFIIAARPAL